MFQEKGPRERKRGENGSPKRVEKREKSEKKRDRKEIKKNTFFETTVLRARTGAGGRGQAPLSDFDACECSLFPSLDDFDAVVWKAFPRGWPD